MTFLNSFEAVRYRGIDGLSFPRLARVNLITGVNGIGKTAALEAMWLFTGRYNTGLLWNGNVQRSTKTVLDPITRLAKGTLELRGMEESFQHSFKAYFQKISDIETTIPTGNIADHAVGLPPVVAEIHIELSGNISEQKMVGVHPTPWGSVAHKVSKPPVGRPTCVILGTRFNPEIPKEYLQRYSDMVRANYKASFTDAINLILPKIMDVEILADDTGEPYLSAVTKDEIQLPLHALGGGVVRLYQLFLDCFTSRGGVLYVDEVENGLHHSVLGEVWSHARVWTHQWNVQLVATTHSDECIRAAMAAFEDVPNELAIHKLYRSTKTGKVEVTTFTGEALEGARELNLETR